MQLSTTICALATPPGEGGIAVIRVSGPDAYAIVEKVFVPIHSNKKVADAKGYTALFGHFLLRGRTMDETVALFYRAPHSYTGEDVIELSVHGGTVMADSLLESLYLAGAVPAAPGEFTRRALLNGRISLTQAEAVMEIISAGGRQGAALASAALDGALAKKIAGIQATLQTLYSHLAAWIDYPEEDVPELLPEELSMTLEEAKQELDTLINGYGAGAILRHGVDCVLCGRPNVGKSTLLNLLAGFDRAIVTPVAGTTRDVVEQSVQLGEIRLNLFDTAGLRQTEDPIEAEGIRRSWRKLEEAGLILAVFDGAEDLSDEDRELARRCAGRPALALINKEDKPPRLDPAEIVPCFQKVISVSCKEESSRPLIEQAVSELLGTNRVDPHAASLSGQRQLAAAVRARDALREALSAIQMGFGLDAISVCMDDALAALCDLTGENASEAVINEVFERFCVGK